MRTIRVCDRYHETETQLYSLLAIPPPPRRTHPLRPTRTRPLPARPPLHRVITLLARPLSRAAGDRLRPQMHQGWLPGLASLPLRASHPNSESSSSVLSNIHNPLQPSQGFSQVYWVCAYLFAGDPGVDISAVSSYKPVQKRNNNLTPDTYPK